MRIFSITWKNIGDYKNDSSRFLCLLTLFSIIFLSSLHYSGAEVVAQKTQIDPSDYCRSIGGRLGKCVVLQQCTLFSEWLRQRPVVKNRIKTIVQYTCYFDLILPKVCCPLRYINEHGNHPDDIRQEIAANLIQDNGGFGNAPSSNSNLNSNNNDVKSPQIQTQTSSKSLKKTYRTQQSFSTTAPLLFPTETATSELEINTRVNKVIKISDSFVRTQKFQRLMPELKDCGSPMALGRPLGTYGSHPWIALIGIKDLKTNKFVHSCSGSIINQRYILTSAKCISRQKQPTHVRLGDYNLDTTYDYGSQYLPTTTFKDIEIEKLIRHPSYDKFKRTNNIALIRLENDIDFSATETFMRPVCLPFANEYNRSDVLKFDDIDSKIKTFVAGWGKISSNATGNKILNEAPVQITSHEECTLDGQYPSPKEFYCISGNLRQNMCILDAGGALLTPIRLTLRTSQLPTAKIFQLGIFSSGPNYNQCRNSRSISDDNSDINSNDNHRLLFFRSGVSAIPSSSLFVKVNNYLDWILDSIEA